MDEINEVEENDIYLEDEDGNLEKYDITCGNCKFYLHCECTNPLSNKARVKKWQGSTCEFAKPRMLFG